MRGPRIPLLCIDTKTGLVARYSKKLRGLVAGLNDVHVEYAQIPTEWLPGMREPACIATLETYRKQGIL